MKRQFLGTLLIATACAVCSCSGEKEESSGNSSDSVSLEQKAVELAHKFIITDGHIDLPYRLSQNMEDISVETENGEFDYVRAKEGGLDAPFMSIFISPAYQETGGAKEHADSLIELVRKLTFDHPDKFGLANSPDEVVVNFEKGIVSLPMGMENGAPIGDDLANLDYFHKRGIRYITLTHGKDNQICDSSYDTTRTWNGLSPFGREVVKEMNKIGIMVDVSHISDSAFYQVMDITSQPVIASHSSCRHFVPGFERNMSDDMIKKIGENGGVVQINFGSTFIDEASKESLDKVTDHVSGWIESEKVEADDSLAKAYAEDYRKRNFKFSDVEKVADHIDHVVAIAGIDHVGFGSDFDGVGDTLPEGLKDVSDYPNLILALLKRGYSEEEIEKICYKNVFRVWNAVGKGKS